MSSCLILFSTKMDYIRRVYVAGVGYTCYLTEVLDLPVQKNKDQTQVTKKEISIANLKTSMSVSASTKLMTNSNSNHSRDSAAPSVMAKYFLNLKIGYSDIKSIDVTKYITDKFDPIEILVVGKEILSTPGYQESLLESEAAAGMAVSPIKAIVIIRGSNKEKVNSLAAYIRNLRPYSVYKGIGLRLQGEPLNLKVVVKNKQKS